MFMFIGYKVMSKKYQNIVFALFSPNGQENQKKYQTPDHLYFVGISKNRNLVRIFSSLVCVKTNQVSFSILTHIYPQLVRNVQKVLHLV